jgi:hypothetical protein
MTFHVPLKFPFISLLEDDLSRHLNFRSLSAKMPASCKMYQSQQNLLESNIIPFLHAKPDHSTPIDPV